MALWGERSALRFLRKSFGVKEKNTVYKKLIVEFLLGGAEVSTVVTRVQIVTAGTVSLWEVS